MAAVRETALSVLRKTNKHRVMAVRLRKDSKAHTVRSPVGMDTAMLVTLTLRTDLDVGTMCNALSTVSMRRIGRHSHLGWYTP